MTDTLFLADFRRAAASPRCPFCALSETATTRYIGTLLNELALAPDIHQKLAQSRGFCPDHAQRLSATARKENAAGGAATLTLTVLQSLRAELTQGLAAEVPSTPARPRWRRSATATLGTTLAARLQPAAPCLVCVHQEEGESFALGQLIEDLQETQGSGALARLYQESAGACLRHVQRLLERAPDAAGARWLVEVQCAHWSAREAHLHAYRLGKRERIDDDTWV